MKACLIIIAMVLIGQPLLAQNTIGIPLVINYSKNDYRAGTQTWDIDQDSSGRMYFANNEGLVTFDGNFWKVYPLPNKTIVRSLAIGKNGMVFAGGQGELGYFMPDEQGKLKYVSLIPLLPEKQRIFADIWDIEISGESVYFRASDQMIMELRNNRFSLHPPLTNWLFMKRMGKQLFAQDRVNGLYYYRNNTWTPAKNNQLLAGSVVSGMIPAGQDSTIVFTYDKKTFTLFNDSLTVRNNFNLPKESFDFFRVGEMNGGRFTAATPAEGCLILDLEGNLIQKISRIEGLQNNNVRTVFLDKDGNLWAGLNNGISFIAFNSAFKYITPNKINEVSGFSARIFKDHLYIGSSDGAYFVPLKQENKDLSFLKGDFRLVGNSNGQVWRLDEVNQQLLMAHNSGCFHIQNQIAEKISTDAGWLFIPTSAVPPSPNILTGTYAGLKKIRYENGKFRDGGNLPGLYESLRFLTIDNEDGIWASHPYRGIYRILLNKDTTAYTATLFTEKDGLPSSLDNHVFKIKNRIVYCTVKGVYEYDANLKKFIPSSLLAPVLGTTEIRYMNEDNEGNIWFCSGKKLGLIDYNNTDARGIPAVIYFPEINGQILSGFENVYPYNRENIFIASEKGIIHLNYEKYRAKKLKLNLVLGTVKVTGNADSTIFGGYHPASGNSKKLATLPSSFDSYHFEFSSPAYGLQKNIEYSFMLEGLESRWTHWNPKPEKEYTNLPFGNYVFRVKARDNLGNESDEVLYRFTIMPPWYRTVWAYFIYFLMVIALVYGIMLWQKKKLHRQKLIYEEKQRQMSVLHQLEIEHNEKEIMRLKNEKLESEIILKTKELADTSMHLVERSDALLKVKEELQKIYRKTNENHDIKKTLILLNDIEKNNDSWEKFALHFDEVNDNYLKNLKARFPKLTSSDLKVCAYLKLNLSSKEIAQLMNISVRGVEISRYRLRKKLGLSSEQSITAFLESL
ncbi:MAG TPA: triple tyrosine motif-containing protein [Chitinophagaceae bacterium]|nr:triple tyrosine motif-containing protein [Chitinophagaceae bacterium]